MNTLRFRRLALALATILCGLIWRLAPLHLPPFFYKYGGSALYAIMIFWLVAAAAPKARRITTALWAMALVTAIECIKLVHTPALDAFRLTLAGKLILGRYFSGYDLIAYAVGILVIAIAASAAST
jgi:Protein of unknown function (DUF2809)